jgi:hypothetical protein
VQNIGFAGGSGLKNFSFGEDFWIFCKAVGTAQIERGLARRRQPRNGWDGTGKGYGASVGLGAVGGIHHAGAEGDGAGPAIKEIRLALDLAMKGGGGQKRSDLVCRERFLFAAGRANADRIILERNAPDGDCSTAVLRVTC